MNIKTMQVGPLGTNCYLLEDEHTHAAAVIDPGGDGARIEAQLRADGPAWAATCSPPSARPPCPTATATW